MIASYGRLTSKGFNLYLSMRSYKRSSRGRIAAFQYVTLAWEISKKGETT